LEQRAASQAARSAELVARYEELPAPVRRDADAVEDIAAEVFHVLVVARSDQLEQLHPLSWGERVERDRVEVGPDIHLVLFDLLKHVSARQHLVEDGHDLMTFPVSRYAAHEFDRVTRDGAERKLRCVLASLQ